MAHIHIERDHHFSKAKARKIAFQWAEQVENEFDMACTYEEGDDEDLVSFSRSGVKGTLRVCARRFELDAQLGILLGAFKGRIESEIVKNLDELMAAHPAAKTASAGATKAAPKSRKKPAA